MWELKSLRYFLEYNDKGVNETISSIVFYFNLLSMFTQ